MPSSFPAGDSLEKIMAKFQIGADMPAYGYFEDFYDETTIALLSTTDETVAYEDSNGARIILHGTGFTSSGGSITGGQITGVEWLHKDGGSLVVITAASFAASTATVALAPGAVDIWEFMTFLSSGKDEFRSNGLGSDFTFGDNHGNDLFIASAAGSYTSGSKGNDIIRGGAAWDTISFESTFWLDDDKRGIKLNVSKGTIVDSWGDADKFDKKFEEYVGSEHADRMVGSTRDEAFAGMKGNDKIDGGKGVDDIRYFNDERRDGDDGIVADLAKGKIRDGYGDVDTVKNIEQVFGTFFDDVFKGDDRDNSFRGLSGVDTFNGRKGIDEINFDWFQDIVGEHGVDVDLSLPTGQIKDDGFGNVETAISIEKLAGGDFADKLKLSSAGGFAWGADGDDTLTAGKAGDWLGGGHGADTFVFGTLAASGKPGKTGAHSFIFDFDRDEGDLVDLSSIGGTSFIGTSAFSQVAGELRFKLAAGNTFIEGDMDGNGKADLILEFEGHITFVSDDLVLA
jgi:hypothetical protein